MNIYFIVTLQPLEFDSKEKHRHKFMVQSLECPGGFDVDANVVVCYIIFNSI